MPKGEKQVAPDEITRVAELLARAYPYIQRQKAAEGVFSDTPLESLVRAVLSQNSTDVNRDRAFASLRRQFPSWRQVAEAPAEDVAKAITTNFNITKAKRIQAILRFLHDEYGDYSLDFLREWPTERIVTFLTGLPGIGRKSAAVISLFALGRPVVPVDRHVLRIAQRLGWLPEEVAAERAHDLLQRLIPEELILPLHMGMWAHGHATCRPTPICAQCAIYHFCLFPAKTAPEPPVEKAIAITAGGKTS
jgi:endonuclease-3